MGKSYENSSQRISAHEKSRNVLQDESVDVRLAFSQTKRYDEVTVLKTV